MNTDSYRDILKQHFALRRTRNGSYSLRAFARDIQLSPSRLSEVIASGQRLSRESAERIGRRLGLTQQELRRFCDLADLEHPKDSVRSAAKARLVETPHSAGTTWRNLQDEVTAVTNWFHLAILEMLDFSVASQTVSAMASRLGLAVTEITDALATLSRLKLVRISGNKIRKTHDNLATPSELPSGAVRNLHDQLLGKAGAALHEQPFHRRSFDALVLALPEDRLPEAMLRIRDFVGRFNSEFGNAPNKDQVYCLAVQFFALTKETST